MRTKMPQRPKQPKQHEHGPRPYDPNDADEAQQHNSHPGTEPFAFPENHSGMKGVTESANSNRDVGQYTGEGSLQT